MADPMRLHSSFPLTLAFAASCLAALAGCTSTQILPSSSTRTITLASGELEAHGIAFITPSTTTGREEEKQAIAHVFGEAIKRDRANVRVVALPETLSAVNKANLADAYKRMYDEHRDTGLFQRAMLERVGNLTGSRYIAQLQLQEFSEGSKERFGIFGLRILAWRRATPGRGSSSRSGTAPTAASRGKAWKS
jgi:hypothetical protein